MTCRTPPVSISAFDQANHLWPTRSRATDGTCPSRQHSGNNPTSDHEPDPRLNHYSCAFDLTHDPSSGCDATGSIANWIAGRRDPRVKYLIRGTAARDEMCGPNTGWRWERINQVNHRNHLHVSLVHSMAVLHDVSPWFTETVAKPPEDPDVADKPRAHMVYADAPMRRPRKYKGKRPTFMADDVGNARLLTPEDVAFFLFLGAPAPVQFPRDVVEGLHDITRMDGRS